MKKERYSKTPNSPEYGDAGGGDGSSASGRGRRWKGWCSDVFLKIYNLHEATTQHSDNPLSIRITTFVTFTAVDSAKKYQY